MYPFASASVLSLPHACSQQSGALGQRRLLLSSPAGHVVALSLATVEPTLMWTSAPKARHGSSARRADTRVISRLMRSPWWWWTWPPTNPATWRT